MKIVSAKKKYNDNILPEMKKAFGYKNNLQVPKINKVVVNVGIGKITKEGDKIDEIFEAVKNITGQLPLKTKAKKSIAGFKLREGQEVGITVTLRNKRMWDFIDRLINVVIPRVRDFQGINISSVDSSGNFSMGIKEHVVFPEIMAEKVKHIFSLQVCISTTAKKHEEGVKLFRLLGFPLKERENK